MTFNKFDDVYLLTGGGAGTEVVSVRVYEFLTARFDIGAAAAQALVLAARRSSCCSLIYLRFFAPTRRGGGDADGPGDRARPGSCGCCAGSSSRSCSW